MLRGRTERPARSIEYGISLDGIDEESDRDGIREVLGAEIGVNGVQRIRESRIVARSDAVDDSRIGREGNAGRAVAADRGPGTRNGVGDAAAVADRGRADAIGPILVFVDAEGAGLARDPSRGVAFYADRPVAKGRTAERDARHTAFGVAADVEFGDAPVADGRQFVVRVITERRRGERGRRAGAREPDELDAAQPCRRNGNGRSVGGERRGGEPSGIVDVAGDRDVAGVGARTEAPELVVAVGRGERAPAHGGGHAGHETVRRIVRDLIGRDAGLDRFDLVVGAPAQRVDTRSVVDGGRASARVGLVRGAEGAGGLSRQIALRRIGQVSDDAVGVADGEQASVGTRLVGKRRSADGGGHEIAGGVVGEGQVGGSRHVDGRDARCRVEGNGDVLAAGQVEGDGSRQVVARDGHRAAERGHRRDGTGFIALEGNRSERVDGDRAEKAVARPLVFGTGSARERHFDGVAHRVQDLGDGVRGRLPLDGRALHGTVRKGGDRRGRSPP